MWPSIETSNRGPLIGNLMGHNRHHYNGNKWMISVCVALAYLSTTCLQGCRTAASLGLPVSGSMNYLLPDAANIRQKVGHRDDIASELAKSTLRPHVVEAGDALTIEPNDFNSPIQMPSDHTVQQDGTIGLGRYGRIEVAGKTVQAIQTEVQSLVEQLEMQRMNSQASFASHVNGQPLEQAEIPDLGITVRLISNGRDSVYVMGEVNAPGSYPLVGSETALDALIAAGGLSEKANEHKIILTRPQSTDQPRVILPICYQQILQLGETSTNYQLQPGDRIYVPSLTVWEDIKASNPLSKGRSCPHCGDFSRK